MRVKAIFYAVAAASLYAINSPLSKLLLKDMMPTMMASCLYLGAGIGMLIFGYIRRKGKKDISEAGLSIRELPYIIGMVVLDIAAPIFLMIGLNNTSAANASLLNNFEIVITSLIALLLFNESISIRLWISIMLITVSSIILSVNDASSISFSTGSVFVLLACCCWGLENNCTRKLSLKDPLQIVVIKGLGSGIGSLGIAFALGEQTTDIVFIAAALILGFFSYGLSIFLYIYAQRDLGAAKTSAYYAVSPFIGAGLSLAIFREIPSVSFIVAFLIMVAGTYFASSEVHAHKHCHAAVTHEHTHSHDDGHHNHKHETDVLKHNHVHTHEECIHAHAHTQDIHHSHKH